MFYFWEKELVSRPWVQEWKKCVQFGVSCKYTFLSLLRLVCPDLELLCLYQYQINVTKTRSTGTSDTRQKMNMSGWKAILPSAILFVNTWLKETIFWWLDVETAHWEWICIKMDIKIFSTLIFQPFASKTKSKNITR